MRLPAFFHPKHRSKSRRIKHRYVALALAVLLCIGFAPGFSATQAAEPNRSQYHAQALVNHSRQLYQSGRLDQAEAELRQALQQYQSQDNIPGQAMAQSNLALVLGQRGNWAEANQLISQSIQLLESASSASSRGNTAQRLVLAQSWNVQGKLQLAQGQTDDALKSWEAAEIVYEQAGDGSGKMRSQLRQARALQAMGFYRKALDELKDLEEELVKQPASPEKVAGLRELGDTLQVVGSLKDAETTLKEAERNAQIVLTQASNPQLQQIAQHSLFSVQLSLANTAYARGLRLLKLEDTSEKKQDNRFLTDAQKLYGAVANQSETTAKEAESNNSGPAIDLLPAQSLIPFKAGLNLLSLMIETEKPQTDIRARWQSLKQQLDQLPPSRSGVEARINLAHNLMRWNEQEANAVPIETIETILATAYKQAQALQDLRTQTYVLGELGSLYQGLRNYDRALEFTGKAIQLAKEVNAPDVIYRWYAQEGELYKARYQWHQQNNRSTEAERDRQSAIQAYSAAVATLKTLRTDLASINPEVMFSFQESVEPIHRDLVSLLLKSSERSPNNQPSADTLELVQKIMESLRVEELHEYLRAACLAPKKVNVDEITKTTTVLYPIILEDQLAIIVSLPGQKLQLYSTLINATKLEKEVKGLRQGLRNSISLSYKDSAKLLYRQLFPKELEKALKNSETQTLVFVLDGVLRNIPMAALYDESGEQFLIEKYSLAVTPGLQLTEPEPLRDRNLSTVAFGLSTERDDVQLLNGTTQNFSELPAVLDEIKTIEKQIPKTETLLDQEFTQKEFSQKLKSSDVPIVHMATHGQFSSDRDATFLLTTPQPSADQFSAKEGLIDIDTLAEALAVKSGQRSQPIELLVLSACETAVGDDRAALGIAGVALRSGARSTIASLWTVDDSATSLLMQNFYKELQSQSVSKAEALQKAQIAVLRDESFRGHPYSWASFILVGNWL